MMKEFNVIQRDTENNEYAYTDGLFFFTHDVSKVLLNIHDKYFEFIKDKQIEICCYRDFLQPLGSEPLSFDKYYKIESGDDLNDEVLIKNKLFHDMYSHFKGRKALVIGLTDSYFYHFGTINEIHDLYFVNSSVESQIFRSNLSLTKLKNTRPINNDTTTNCYIISSDLSANFKPGNFNIIEFCSITDKDVQLNMGDHVLLSNCMISKEELPGRDDNNFTFNLPNDICIHTIPVRSKTDRIAFVTIFFNRNDDLKKNYEKICDLKFLGTLMPVSLAESVKSSRKDQNSIWSVRLFETRNTMSESFVQAVEFINKYLSTDAIGGLSSVELKKSEGEALSLFEILQRANYDRMLAFRSLTNTTRKRRISSNNYKQT
jgi:hypothetical protein